MSDKRRFTETLVKKPARALALSQKAENVDRQRTKACAKVRALADSHKRTIPL